MHLGYICSSYSIIFVIFFFDEYEVFFPVSFDYFWMKVILLDIQMDTPPCSLGVFAWKNFLQSFTLKMYLSLLRMCVSSMMQNDGSCLSIQCASLCLFFWLGGKSPLMLRGINGQ